MKKWMLATVLISSCTLGVAVGARPGPRADRPAAGRPGAALRGHALVARALQNPEIWESLGITGEQADALHALHRETRKELIPLRSAVELAELDVGEAMEAGDEKALMAAIDAAGRARIALEQAQARGQLKARSILGEETLEKVRAELQRRVRERRERVEEGPRPTPERAPRPGYGPGASFRGPPMDRMRGGVPPPPDAEGFSEQPREAGF